MKKFKTAAVSLILTMLLTFAVYFAGEVRIAHSAEGLRIVVIRYE